MDDFPVPTDFKDHLPDLMFADPLVVSADVSVANAIARLHQKKTSFTVAASSPIPFPDCILIQQEGQISGIFVPADLVPLLASGQQLADLPIGQVGHSPTWITLSTPSNQAVQTLTLNPLPPSPQPPYLLVVNEQQQWLGVIATVDLAWESVSSSLQQPHSWVMSASDYLAPKSSPPRHRDIDCGNSQVTKPQGVVVTKRGDRQKIKLSLHASEEKLHQLASSLKEVFWITNATGTEVIYISPSYEQIYGRPPEYLYRHPLSWLDAVVPEDREWVNHFWANLPQEAFEVEYQITKTDGTRRWVRDRGIAIYSETGDVYRLGGIIEDITERKHLEASLSQREKEFRTLAEHSPGIITRFDRQWRYTYVNPAIEEVLGIAAHEFIGKTSRELGLSDYLINPLENRLHRIFNTGQAESSKFGFPTSSGDRYYQCQLVPEFAADGSVNSVLGITIDVTQLKQAEENLKQLNEELELRVQQRTKALVESQAALQEQTRILQAILNSIGDGVLVAAPDGQMMMYNPAASNLLGYIPPRLSTTEWQQHYNIFLPDQITPYPLGQLPLERAIRGEVDDHVETYIHYSQRPEGAFLDVTVRPIRDEAGEVQGGVVTFRDITQKKHLEETLRKSEQQFRSLVSNIPGAVYQWGNPPDYKVEFISEAIATISGYSAWEFLLGERTYKSIVHPDDRPLMDAIVAEAIAQKQPFSAEYRISCANGKTRWVAERGQGIFDDAETLLYIDGAIFDITTRKQIEAERQQVELALQESERRLQAIIDSSPVAIYVKDLHGHYTLVNQLCAATKALEPDMMFGRTDDEIVSRELAQQWHVQDQEVLTVKKPIEFEEFVVINDVSTTYLTLKFPLFDGAGSPYAVCGISTDITERKQVENQIRDSLRQKDLVIQEIHHRVKNNLQIVSSLMTLQSRSTNDETTVQLFKDCQNRILSIALIHEQLYKSRDLANIDMAEYVRNLVSQVFASYQGNVQTIELHLDLAEVFLNLDTVLPCGLLINELLSNSLKYAFPHHEKGEIDIRLYAEENQNQVILVVGDNGVGLPPGFDFRKSRSLGLRLVCDLASQLKGTIALLPGQGTIFQVTFAELKSKARL